MNRIHGALVALILLLTACGSAESSFRDQLNDLGFSDETSDCLIDELDARGLGVEDITDDAISDGMPAGAEEAIEACLSPALDDLADDDAARVVDADDSDDDMDDDDIDDADDMDDGDDDMDDGDIMTRDLTAFETAFVRGAMDEGASEEAARCVLGEFAERDLDLMELAVADPDEFPDDLLSALFACGDELIEGGLFDFADTAGANGYGDDAELDALWDACAAGDGNSCDELYFTSAFGSDYERFGDTCGETAAGGGLCGDGSGGGLLFGDDDPFDYGDDAELDVLWDACAAGDGDACDELYFTSPIDSVYEEFGNTCGGAVPEGAFLCATEI